MLSKHTLGKKYKNWIKATFYIFKLLVIVVDSTLLRSNLARQGFGKIMKIVKYL